MRIYVLLSLGLILHIFAFSQTEASLLKKADSLKSKGKYSEAIAIYSMVIKINPKAEMAWRERGRSYLETKKYLEAEKDYKEALKLNPSCGNCYAYLGFMKFAKNDLVNALSYAEQGIKAEPANNFPYLFKARVLAAQNKYDEAELAFAKALELDPNNVNTFYYRAEMHNETGNTEKAFNDFTTVIRLDPSIATAYFGRAVILANQQKFDEALKEIATAIEKDNTQAHFHKMVANLYYYKDNPDSAIKYYSKAIQLDPKDHESYFYRSRSKYNLEDMDAACKDLKQAIAMIPKDGNQYALSIKFEAEGLFTESCDSTKPGYYYHRGIANYNLKKFDLAIKIYDQGLTRFPHHALMTSFRGNAYLASGNYKKAEEDYTRAIDLRKNLLPEVEQSWNYRELDGPQKDLYTKGLLTAIYNTRAEARMKSGNDASAAEDIDEVLANHPENAHSRDHTYVLKGVLAMNQNDNSAALTAFNKAIALNGENINAFVNRAIIKMNLAYKAKVINQSIQLGGMGMHGSFNLPPKEKTIVNKDNLRAALVDVNKAIALDKNYAYAYYVRALVKNELGEPGVCYDLLLADKLGLHGMKELITAHKCNQD